MVSRICLTIALLFALAQVTQAAGPRVIFASPDDGQVDVSPDLKEIRITFDTPMSDQGYSVPGGGDSYPDIGDLKWIDDKTLSIPVTLKPNHDYWLSINSDRFKRFRSVDGEPAEMYPIEFKTRAAGAPAAKPDTTPEQNKHALAVLAKEIDEDYSYRDLHRVDWHAELLKRRKQFEDAKTVNEFAIRTARLLRLAEDGHVWIEADGMRIGTHANSSPPNFNFNFTSQVVPNWKQWPDGIISGRFDDDKIGYILFSQCNDKQATEFDKALDELLDTKALIVDVRANGGGGDGAAEKVAGRFTAEETVYSCSRVRQGGDWDAPRNCVVRPRDDAKRYQGKVVVLIGPKVYSSAESFVLMMKLGGKATLVGGVTAGASGGPKPHELGNGVTVYLPSFEHQFPDGTVLEDRGVQADVYVRTNLEDLRNADPVLDEALKLLRGEKLTKTASAN